jgi:hypothetical protein
VVGISCEMGFHALFRECILQVSMVHMSMKRKALVMVGAIALAIAVIAAALVLAELSFVKEGTELVADIPSPGGKWDAMLMVRNGGKFR